MTAKAAILRDLALTPEPKCPPASIVREDTELIAYTVGQISILLARLIFAENFGDVSRQQRMELAIDAHEFVMAQIEIHVPRPETEPCAMSAAKYEAES